MTLLKKHPAYLGILTGVVFVTALALYATVARANPSNLASSATGTTATTTALSYLTPGTGTTTTPVYDSYEVDGTNQINKGNTFTADSAALALQVNASSTATVYNIALEYSNGTNCGTTPAGCDWYSDTLTVNEASTSPVINLNTLRTYQLTFASSSVGGVAIATTTGLLGINGTLNRETRLIQVRTPMRYVRAVITVTGANGAVVEAAFIPKKESK